MTLLLIATIVAVSNVPQASARTTRTRTTHEACTDPLAYQVLLDRHGFSPGEIDGRRGPNLSGALRAFQKTAGLPETGAPDCDTWTHLSGTAQDESVVEYQLTDADLAGPFLQSRLPDRLADQAALPALGYESALEALAERFHASPRLLRTLNPHPRLIAGATIRVPAVTPFDPAQKPVPDQGAGELIVTVSRSSNTLEVRRPDGSLVFFAPVSSGSEHDPLPLGSWKVNGTAWQPPFHYNPRLFWDAESTDTKAVIEPGPNNPVGVVWIDINVPHYGLHGTPSPALVGHAQSHGCVRLTNWDAARLASLVKPGTRVEFVP